MFLYHVKRMAPFLYHKSGNDITCWVNGPFLESQSRNDYIYLPGVMTCFFIMRVGMAISVKRVAPFLYHKSWNGYTFQVEWPISLSGNYT